MAEFGVALVLAQIAVDEKSNEITAMPKLLEMLSLPAGLEPGSPFTQSIEATAIYMRYEHAVSYRCLSKLFADLYGGQRGLGEAWQICLAYQLCNCQYAIDAGNEDVDLAGLRFGTASKPSEGQHATAIPGQSGAANG